jgi:hypothetical protein
VVVSKRRVSCSSSSISSSSSGSECSVMVVSMVVAVSIVVITASVDAVGCCYLSVVPWLVVQAPNSTIGVQSVASPLLLQGLSVWGVFFSKVGQ